LGLTGESPQTLHPKRLAKAPELFYLLCDCVEIEPEKRVDVGSLMSNAIGVGRATTRDCPYTRPYEKSRSM